MLLARGAALVGRRVVWEFSGVPFAGAVVAHEGRRWAYRVRYSDGDKDTAAHGCAQATLKHAAGA